MRTIAIDIETTVIDENRATPYQDRILAIAVNDGNEIYLTTDLERIEQWLTDPEIIKIFHNGAFDLQFLMYQMFNIQVKNIWDTMIVERMLTSGTNMPCDLSSVVSRYCDIHLGKDIRESFWHHTGEVSPTQQAYALNDVRYLLAVYEEQKTTVHARGMDDIVRIENLLVPIIAEMELTGIGFAEEGWNKIVITEQERLPELEREAQRLLADSFEMDIFTGQFVGTLNLNSPIQLLQAFKQKGIHIQSTDEGVLSKLASPEARAILAYRECIGRLKWDYPKYVNPVTERVHPEFVQTGADTGRFSCKNPNLQNVPKERRFRRMFVARKGYKLITADYSQQELRVLAELSQDRNLLEACKTTDVHLANAKLIFSDSTITAKDPRRNIAKNTGFALAYGAGLKGFAVTAGLTIEEAKTPYNRIHALYSQAEEWGRKSWVFLQQNGYTVTLGGRRRYFPWVMDDPGKYLTVARNSPVQGSSADMEKLAMVFIHERIQGYDARLVLCIHDEIVVEVRTSQAGEVARIVKNAMEDAGAYYVKSIPVPANAAIADTWTK